MDSIRPALTLQQAAQKAIDMQDACNLSGLVNDFPRITHAIWEEANRLGKGTEFVNTHPIVILVLDKLCDLARMDHFSGRSMEIFGKAYEECKKLANGE